MSARTIRQGFGQIVVLNLDPAYVNRSPGTDAICTMRLRSVAFRVPIDSQKGKLARRKDR